MKTDKEYPATHSMSTSWYMVDDEGNIAIMQFDDNGPIPLGVHQDGNFANNLIFGEGFHNGKIDDSIQLTKEQIEELLGQPHSVSEQDAWFEVVVKIDKSQKERFLNIVNNSKIEYEGCISEELGLYKIDAWNCTKSNDNSIIKGSGLDQIIKAGIIEYVYDCPELYMDANYNPTEGKMDFVKDFNQAPYYIYLQPYWPDTVQKRMNIPSHPVKISQIKKIYHDKILKIPGKFKDIEDLQIARWFPSVVLSCKNIMHVENNEYALLPMVDGKDRWVLTDSWVFDFYDFCPIKSDNGCKKCDFKCTLTFSKTDVLEPTILFIVPITFEYTDFWKDEELCALEDKMIALSYIPNVPTKNNHKHMPMDKEEIKAKIKYKALCELFKKSSGWLENIISTLRPNVIIIEDSACCVVQTVFPISQHCIEINKNLYPIYRRSELDTHKEEIIRLSKKPYQGSVSPYSYSIEEMEELKKQGKAHD